MRVSSVILSAVVGLVSARSSCSGGDPAGNVELAACIFAELSDTECLDEACNCTQGSSITSCYSQYCNGHVPTAIAARQSTACLNSGNVAHVSPIAYLDSNPTATVTSNVTYSASTVSAPAATSLIAVVSTATSSATAASAATLPSTTTTAPTATEPPTNTISDPPTPTASGAAKPAAASKATASLDFAAPVGGLLAAVIGLLTYL